MNILLNQNKQKKNLFPTHTYPSLPTHIPQHSLKYQVRLGICHVWPWVPSQWSTTTLQSMTIYVLFCFLGKVLHYTLLLNSLTLLWGLLWRYKHSALSKRQKWAFKIGFKKHSSWKQELEIPTLGRLEQKILSSRPASQTKSVSSADGQTDGVKSPEMPLLFPPI